MNIKLALVGITALIALICLKRRFDPHNDAFRTEDREGWHIKKASVISLNEYRKRKVIGEVNVKH